MNTQWSCWRCGGLHAMRHQRRPNAGVNYGSPTRAEMQARLDAFLARQGVVGCDKYKTVEVMRANRARRKTT